MIFKRYRLGDRNIPGPNDRPITDDEIYTIFERDCFHCPSCDEIYEVVEIGVCHVCGCEEVEEL